MDQVAPKVLFISFEATEPSVTTAQLQQVTLTFAEKPAQKNELIFLKGTSFYVDNYTAADFFDVLKENPVDQPLSYKHLDAVLKINKRYSKEEALMLIQKAVKLASYVVVHNGLEYHIPILQREGIDFSNKLLIDTSVHIPYPASIKTRKLLHLCAEHNFLPYVGSPKPRTASANEAMMKLLSFYSIDGIISAVLEDKKNCIKLRAIIDFAQNEEAKKLGFKFDYPTKQWTQRVSQERCDELLAIMGPQYLEILNKTNN